VNLVSILLIYAAIENPIKVKKLHNPNIANFNLEIFLFLNIIMPDIKLAKQEQIIKKIVPYME